MDAPAVAPAMEAPPANGNSSEMAALREQLASEKARRAKLNADMLRIREKVTEEIGRLEATIAEQQRELEAIKAARALQAEEAEVTAALLTEKDAARARMQREIEHAFFQRDCAFGDLEEWQSQVRERDETIEQQAASCAELREQVTDAEARVLQLTGQVERLTRELQQRKKVPAAPAVPEADPADVAALKQERADAVNEAGLLRSSVASLKAQVDEERLARANDMRKVLELTTERTDILSYRDAAIRERDAATERAVVAERTMARMRAEAAEAAAQLAEARQAAQVAAVSGGTTGDNGAAALLRTQLAAAERAAASQRSLLAAAEREAGSAKAALSAAEARLAAVDDAQSRLRIAEAQIAALQESERKGQAQLSAAQAACAAASHRQDELQRLLTAAVEREQAAERLSQQQPQQQQRTEPAAQQAPNPPAPAAASPPMELEQRAAALDALQRRLREQEVAVAAAREELALQLRENADLRRLLLDAPLDATRTVASAVGQELVANHAEVASLRAQVAHLVRQCAQSEQDVSAANGYASALCDYSREIGAVALALYGQLMTAGLSPARLEPPLLQEALEQLLRDPPASVQGSRGRPLELPARAAPARDSISAPLDARTSRPAQAAFPYAQPLLDHASQALRPAASSSRRGSASSSMSVERAPWAAPTSNASATALRAGLAPHRPPAPPPYQRPSEPPPQQQQQVQQQQRAQRKRDARAIEAAAQLLEQLDAFERYANSSGLRDSPPSPPSPLPPSPRPPAVAAAGVRYATLPAAGVVGGGGSRRGSSSAAPHRSDRGRVHDDGPAAQLRSPSRSRSPVTGRRRAEAPTASSAARAARGVATSSSSSWRAAAANESGAGEGDASWRGGPLGALSPPAPGERSLPAPQTRSRGARPSHHSFDGGATEVHGNATAAAPPPPPPQFDPYQSRVGGGGSSRLLDSQLSVADLSSAGGGSTGLPPPVNARWRDSAMQHQQQQQPVVQALSPPAHGLAASAAPRGLGDDEASRHAAVAERFRASMAYRSSAARPADLSAELSSAPPRFVQGGDEVIGNSHTAEAPTLAPGGAGHGPLSSSFSTSRGLPFPGSMGASSSSSGGAGNLAVAGGGTTAGHTQSSVRRWGYDSDTAASTSVGRPPSIGVRSAGDPPPPPLASDFRRHQYSGISAESSGATAGLSGSFRQSGVTVAPRTSYY